MDDHKKITELRNRVAANPGQMSDVEFLLNHLDRRETELLAANNRLVSERNAERGRREHFEMAVEWLLRHNGVRQLKESEEARHHLIIERDLALDNARELRDALAQVARSASLVDRAVKWCRAINALERARRGGGNLLEANHAYTEAHLALKAEGQTHL